MTPTRDDAKERRPKTTTMQDVAPGEPRLVTKIVDHLKITCNMDEGTVSVTRVARVPRPEGFDGYITNVGEAIHMDMHHRDRHVAGKEAGQSMDDNSDDSEPPHVNSNGDRDDGHGDRCDVEHKGKEHDGQSQPHRKLLHDYTDRVGYDDEMVDVKFGQGQHQVEAQAKKGDDRGTDMACQGKRGRSSMTQLVLLSRDGAHVSIVSRRKA
jgi:hypothetical protein